MKNPNVRSADEYESMVLAGLQRLGLGVAKAVEIAESRWPMSALDVVSECMGRGLALSESDLTDWLLDHFRPRTHHDDGAPLDACSIAWPRHYVESALAWALANGRGVPTSELVAIPEPTLPEVMTGLRSPDANVRHLAGLILGANLGRGVTQTETPEDVDYLLGPKLEELISQAVAGDAEAVDKLEAVVTDQPPARK